jgi:hypothetical protein
VWRIFVFATTHTQWPQKREFIGINFGNPYYWIIFIYYNVNNFINRKNPMINKCAEDVVMSTVVSEKKNCFSVVCQICSTLNFPLKLKSIKNRNQDMPDVRK